MMMFKKLLLDSHLIWRVTGRLFGVYCLAQYKQNLLEHHSKE
jgi:hypothetical protein